MLDALARLPLGVVLVPGLPAAPTIGMTHVGVAIGSEAALEVGLGAPLTDEARTTGSEEQRGEHEAHETNERRGTQHAERMPESKRSRTSSRCTDGVVTG